MTYLSNVSRGSELSDDHICKIVSLTYPGIRKEPNEPFVIPEIKSQVVNIHHKEIPDIDTESLLLIVKLIISAFELFQSTEHLTSGGVPNFQVGNSDEGAFLKLLLNIKGGNEELKFIFDPGTFYFRRLVVDFGDFHKLFTHPEGFSYKKVILSQNF